MIKAEPLQVAHVHSFDMPVDDDSVGTGEAAVAQVDYLVGVAARVAFSQNPKPDGLYIAVQQMDTSDLETAARTVERALSVSGWYVLCTQ